MHALGASTLPTLHENSNEKLVDTHADVTEPLINYMRTVTLYKLKGSSRKYVQAHLRSMKHKSLKVPNKMATVFSQMDDLFCWRSSA